MADYLDPVVATFLAEADKYLGPVRDMRTAALEAAKANDTLAESIVRLDDVMTDMAGPAAAAAGRINDVRNAAAGAAGADESLARESEAAGHAMAGAALGAEAMAHETNIAGDAVGELGGDFEMMSRFALEARERLDNAAAAIDAIGAQSRGAATGINDLRNAEAEAAATADLLQRHIVAASLAANTAATTAASAMNDWRDSIGKAAALAAYADGQFDRMARALDDDAGAAEAGTGAMHNLRNATLGAALATGALGKASDAAGARAAAAAGGGMRLWGTGIRLTGQAIHWLIMGTLEIVSTALPALVAFGAGIAGMASTFDTIGARMSDLVIASGGVRQALLHSVGPLHTIGLGFGTLTKAMAPAAYQIFGSLINDLSGKVGVFSKMAQGAGNALASFASKITSDLAGPAGQQLAGFFQNAVKYMIQWGQVLGNLGHSILNVSAAMLGVGQILLDVLVAISRGILAITSNKIASWIIGVAAALSALYRYGKLAVTIFNWLGGTAIVNAIKYLAALGIEAVATAAEFGILAGAMTFLEGILTPLIATLMGPVGIAIGALVLGLGAWYLATHRAASAQQNLIKSVESAPPTLENLSGGILKLTHALSTSEQTAKNYVNGVHGISFAAAAAAGTSVPLLTNAIKRQAQQLLNLKTGMAQMGGPAGSVNADMEALAIQSGIADTKVSQVNQALDAFMAGVTGGQSGVAGFVTSIKNIGQVAGTTTNNLGTSTKSMTLSVKQFADELGKGTVKGAGAWTNFTQIVGSTMPQLADWFRTAGAEGAITSGKMQQAFLDMAAGMVKFAAKSKQGQSDLVAFAKAQGLNVNTFPQLEDAIKKSHASLDGLNSITATTSGALANLSKMAQNTADVMSSQVTSAISSAALKSSGFYTDINNLTKAMSKNNTTGHDAAYWEAKAAAAYAEAGKKAVTAAGHVSALAAAQAKLHSATYTITTDFVTSGSIPGGGGRHYQGGQGGAGNSVMIVHQHIAGSVLSDQQLARAAQGSGLRKNFRNSGTQGYLPGRLH
jgi:hypothetical protein